MEEDGSTIAGANITKYRTLSIVLASRWK